MKFTFDRFAFGIGLVIGALTYEVAVIIMVYAWPRFAEGYNPVVGLFTTIGLVLIGWYMIRHPEKGGVVIKTDDPE